MNAWRERDIRTEIAALTGLPVYVQNDGTAACGAELVFGKGDRPADFLYFYFGFFIGGGLVLNGRLFSGRTGNAAGVGPMPVPGPDGRMIRLLEVASLSVLATAMDAAGAPSDALWTSPEGWDVPAPILRNWTLGAARGLASATLSTAALIEPEAIYIDGWMPERLRAEIVAETRVALLQMDRAGIDTPDIREGTVGADARALGAAAIPLSQRYLVE
jgi:predicted NBD/HSP70 family sugar kinase